MGITKLEMKIEICKLTHSRPMFHFHNPWKHQETLQNDQTHSNNSSATADVFYCFQGGRGLRSELAEKIRAIQCNTSTGSLGEKRLTQHYVALVFLILLCTLVFRFSGSKLKLRIPFQSFLQTWKCFKINIVVIKNRYFKILKTNIYLSHYQRGWSSIPIRVLTINNMGNFYRQ